MTRALILHASGGRRRGVSGVAEAAMVVTAAGRMQRQVPYYRRPHLTAGKFTPSALLPTSPTYM